MALKKGSDIDSPRAWIFRVAHNLGLKIRAQQDSHPAFDPDQEGQIPSPQMNPEQDYLERERLLWFHQAIGGLSDQQRRCLHLRLEGLRYPEIAAVLGISTSAVGEFLRRALVRLRKAGHA
jgi:RNA polymerase sigma-70 factor (ECF subfamily)